MSVVLAIDLGTSRLKAGLVDVTGALVAEAAVAAPPADRAAGAHEIDPEDWWRGFAALAGELLERAPADFGSIVAVAVCGATRTQVLIDAQGGHVGPAIGWADALAGEDAASLLARSAPGSDELRHVNAFHPLARLAWLSRTAPERL
ncbi:MAG TPA: FGGY family carbohydrate kinase, partial [Hyphomicrobiaceae bacterium]|nr:FGGY family carbohydrate kinase [Hyphomicrobiaceae bacterium]